MAVFCLRLRRRVAGTPGRGDTARILAAGKEEAAIRREK